ncbi:MAG: hypothetical protein D6692_09340 [Planctomycetota bacterium]|nr:MAG: hypothetical protein D6692_09340 [Planctomycetota bacterium]
MSRLGVLGSVATGFSLDPLAPVERRAPAVRTRDIFGGLLGGALFGAGLAGGIATNRRARALAGSIADAAAVSLQQEANAAALRLSDEARRSALILGTIRAVAAERGTGLTGADRATLLSSTLDSARIRSILRQNLDSRSAAIVSSADAQIARLRASARSPFEITLQSAFGAAAPAASIIGSGRFL